MSRTGPTIKMRMCLLKRKFGERGARREAEKRNQRAYHCPLCHAWHLTSRPPKT